MPTQDCATLVLGYYPISLREKDRRRFHTSRTGEAGGRLTLIGILNFTPTDTTKLFRYQKIMFNATKITATSAAQVHSFL
jgi:hypothetical protein